MDFVSGSASLFQQAFQLYRHVSSSRNFSDTTGGLSALVIVEYFRFESWVQASGLVTEGHATGEPVVHEASLRGRNLLAASANWASVHLNARHYCLAFLLPLLFVNCSWK